MDWNNRSDRCGKVRWRNALLSVGNSLHSVYSENVVDALPIPPSRSTGGGAHVLQPMYKSPFRLIPVVLADPKGYPIRGSSEIYQCDFLNPDPDPASLLKCRRLLVGGVR